MYMNKLINKTFPYSLSAETFTVGNASIHKKSLSDSHRKAFPSNAAIAFAPAGRECVSVRMFPPGCRRESRSA
jgi:hypothetical protein